MSEGILLSSVARGTLLPVAERIARLDAALPQIRAVLEGEDDAVAIEATLACLLWETLVQTSWCGFHRRIELAARTPGPARRGLLGGVILMDPTESRGAARRT